MLAEAIESGKNLIASDLGARGAMTELLRLQRPARERRLPRLHSKSKTNMRFEHTTILITGGGSGIGRGLAEAFHRLGNKVIVAGRDRAKLEAVAAANVGVEAMTFDVADALDVRRFARDVAERFPTLDVLVNNAGMMRAEDLKRGEPSDAEATVTTNLLGPIRLTAALLPTLLARPRAAVLNVTSGLAFVPMSSTPTYCATKAALHSYSQSLRDQLAGTPVEVIELIPPYVQTHLTGADHASDPRAMPLDDYIRATMAILTSAPDVREVVIERVAPLRRAEADGTFEATFAFLASLGRERLAKLH